MKKNVCKFLHLHNLSFLQNHSIGTCVSYKITEYLYCDKFVSDEQQMTMIKYVASMESSGYPLDELFILMAAKCTGKHVGIVNEKECM